MDQESVVLEVDPRSVLAAIKQANQAVEGWEKGTVKAGDSMQKSLERMAEMLLKVNDRSRNSMERLTQSIEKQAAAYGRTGVDRLVAERDRIIKKLGDEQGMIDRVTKAYAHMLDVESGKSGGSFQALGRNIENFIKDPLNASKEAASGLMEKIGPLGSALSIAVGALTGVAVAGWQAMKSLGDYGESMEQAALRTGLTAQEIGQFAFAAKAAGQDVSIFNRMMIGLTEAITDNSTEAQRARARLRELGVEIRDDLGQVRPTATILEELSERINRIPSAFDRNRVAMDLFKRAGVEAIPVISELAENLRIARQNGFGPTEDDLRRFAEYDRKVDALEAKWSDLIRKFKDGLVTTLTVSINWIGTGVEWFLNNVTPVGDDARARQEEVDARRIAAAGGIGAHESRSAHRARRADMERRAPEIMRNRDATLKRIEELRKQQQGLVGDFGWLQFIAPTKEELGRAKQASDIKKEIDSLQQMLSEAENATRRSDLKAGKQYIDSLRARFFGTHEGLEQAYRQAKRDVENYRKQLFEPDTPLTKSEAAEIQKSLQSAEQREARARSGLDAEQQRKRFQAEAAAFTKKGDEAELSAIEKIYHERDLLIKQAEKLKDAEAEIAAIRQSADRQASVISRKAWEEFEAYSRKRPGSDLLWIMGPSPAQFKEWREGFSAQDRISDIEFAARRDALNRNAGRALRMMEYGGATGMDAIRAEYQIRIDLAQQLAAGEAERISKEENAAKRSIEIAQAQKDVQREIADAQEEATLKTLELQRQQLDILKREAESVWNTLLTRPSEFGRHIGKTIHSALVRPVAEGLANVTANVLKPIIYGADGQGGIAGLFKGIFGAGRQDPIKIATDLNTAVTAQNSAAVAALTAILAGSMGMSVPAIAAPAAVGGVPVPAITASIPAVSAISGGAGGGNPLSMIFGGGGGQAATTPPFVPSGGSGPTFGGLPNLLRNFKGINWGGLTHSIPRYSMDADGNLTLLKDSRITGVNGVAGAALFAGGAMLAQQGLLGSWRGTWGGVAAGAAGGAMVGFQAGGPLGALIGGAIGGLIGLGEKIAGVETAENQAKRLIKQIYSLNIDNTTAKQIAAIAKQSYGGQVSVAVRSPEVRQLLQLYAQSAGQKSNLFLNDPHGVNLTQAGGGLYQSAVYNSGTPYTYTSNLPVMGPAGSTIPTGNPFGGAITVMVSPEQTTNLWATGVAAGIAGSPRQVAASAVNGGMATSARVNSAIMTLAPNQVAF
jgi:hypothetical protein